MGKNPFHEDLDDTFRGVRVRAHTDDHTYEGWCGRWYYNEHAVIIYDVERDDGEQVGAVMVSHPEMVEHIPSTDPIEEVRVADIAPSPYTERAMDDADHEKFVKLTASAGTCRRIRPCTEWQMVSASTTMMTTTPTRWWQATAYYHLMVESNGYSWGMFM